MVFGKYASELTSHQRRETATARWNLIGMRMSPLVEAALSRFKEKVMISCGGGVKEIRVFGSMARGDAHEFSDLDVFVMVDERDFATVDAIVRARVEVECDLDLPFSISPLILSKGQFDDLYRRERRIAMDIVTEGVAI